MEAAASRPGRLRPLRIVAAFLLGLTALGLAHAVADRYELLAAYPGLTQKSLAVMIALTFVGSVALAFLAFARQRFGLWIVLACAAAELALETWAGFPPHYLVRVPLAAALVFLAARRAWPELRRLNDAT